MAIDHPASARAIEWIRGNLGVLGDLQGEVVKVIWVTVYRAMETVIEAEAAGGPGGLAKDMIQGGDLAWRVDSATRRLSFIREMIPAIRQPQSRWGQLGGGQLLVDILKWDIVEAANMSWFQRARARRSAKADPMYQKPVPSGIV